MSGVTCGSQIAICDLPVHFDTYQGCSHACEYCFVKRKYSIADIRPSNSLKSLSKFINGERNAMTRWCDWPIPIHWGGVSDPFQPLEEKHGISLEALKIFADSGYPFVVSTKGALIGTEKYIDVLKECNSVVQISAVCARYDRMEMGAPSFDDRLKLIETVAPHTRRVIVRIQPYFTDALKDVLENLPRFADAGAYGITIEGMKFIRKRPGLVKLGNENVYPKELLERHYGRIKAAAHDAGLAFFCAENRLRTMGDDLTCCGIVGLDDFVPNRFNLEHLMNGDAVECSPAGKLEKTGSVYGGVWQDTLMTKVAKTATLDEITRAERTRQAFTKIIRGE